MQLVGLNCMFCGQRIVGELDAEFCGECRGPRHLGCRGAASVAPLNTHCQTCGMERSKVPDSLLRPRITSTPSDVVGARSGSSPLLRMMVVLGCMELTAITMFGAGIWLMPTKQDWGEHRNLAVYLSSIFLCIGVLAQFVTIGLYLGTNWSRTIAVAMFILMLPSLV